MQFQGAVVREQGVTFAIVVVKPHVLNTTLEANRTISSFASAFPGMPVVLTAQDSRGRATYYGRRDITNFLSRISPSRIPWKRYTIN
ncbi:hypothetical protein [Bradyrhizobium sp. AUGA SZCCT0042]|uniref:hypothetical protein n=1 Tax=Bradyrhizobium sp. AUGA SZCCT0042 TaxID=2807651 RepID=UPI001BA579A3|nr:hypothetical protein [Bradyrhizobium sp. AUGA SZCCT0042]MBR1297380.1 hypothetical protein [Bradyrhizobium sp. AUGA SZCCT0042]